MKLFIVLVFLFLLTVSSVLSAKHLHSRRQRGGPHQPSNGNGGGPHPPSNGKGGGPHPPPNGNNNSSGGSHPPPHPPPPPYGPENSSCVKTCVNSTVSADGSTVQICVVLNKTDGTYLAEVFARPSNSNNTTRVVLHVWASDGASLETKDNCTLGTNSTVYTCYDSTNCSRSMSRDPPSHPPQSGSNSTNGSTQHHDDDDDDEEHRPPPQSGSNSTNGSTQHHDDDDDDDDDDEEHRPPQGPPPQPRFSEFHFKITNSSSTWSVTAFLAGGEPSATFNSTLLPSSVSTKRKSFFETWFSW